MRIEVQLFATLERYLPAGTRGDSVLLDLPPGATVHDVVDSLKIPSELGCLTVINGQDAALDQVLAPGDVLSMFPPLAGGA